MWRTIAKTESETAEFSDARSVGLAETVENLRQKFFFDSDSRVSHAQFDKIIVALDFQSNSAVVRRKFDGIRKQIPDDLLQDGSGRRKCG